VVAIDSTKPDVDEGEVGREHYGWLDASLRGWDEGPRIVVIHHHILAVPGTGRDVDNLRDAGDVMAILRELEVDLVLSGPASSCDSPDRASRAGSPSPNSPAGR
jgi:3',5'-cyclic-AMP phosphodiesterase